MLFRSVTLRCTYLRDFDGRLHILPNGAMSIVTNHCRGASRVQIEITIPYSQGVDEALALLQAVCDSVAEKNKEIIRESFTALGIVGTNESGMVLRIVGKAESMTQWGLERELRKEIVNAFSRAGIEIPYPRTHVVLETAGGDPS